jgi:hypothetical protein
MSRSRTLSKVSDRNPFAKHVAARRSGVGSHAVTESENLRFNSRGVRSRELYEQWLDESEGDESSYSARLVSER